MKRIVPILTVVALFSAFGRAGESAEQGPPELRLVVLPFSNLTEIAMYDDLSGILDAFLDDILSERAGIALVDRANIRKILKEQELSLSGLTSNQAAHVGRILGANRYLLGSILTVKDEMRIVARVHDTETLAAVTSAEVTGKPGTVLDLCRAIAEKLSKDLTGKKIEVGDVDSTPEVSVHLIRGLGYYYAEDLPRAIASLTQLCLLDEDHEEGRYWLARCYVEIDLSGHAAIEIDEFLERFPESRRIAQVREWQTQVSSTTKESPGKKQE